MSEDSPSCPDAEDLESLEDALKELSQFPPEEERIRFIDPDMSGSRPLCHSQCGSFRIRKDISPTTYFCVEEGSYVHDGICEPRMRKLMQLARHGCFDCAHRGEVDRNFHRCNRHGGLLRVSESCSMHKENA